MMLPGAPQRPPQDLGFGAVVANATRRRFLNRDGTFNVRRTGLSFAESRSIYRHYVTISWPRFVATVVSWYLSVNLIFATAYLACGPGALEGPEDYGGGFLGHYVEAFFFSVQTLATIGYGRISPIGLAPNIIVAVESVAGLMIFALMAGLAFARFSRPRPDIRFSERAVVAPYRGGTALMFRIANARDGELFDVQAEVAIARRALGPGDTRTFERLTLERDAVAFFPLSWTVVHPMDDASPIAGLSNEQLRTTDAEILIRLSAFDETTGQTVHLRSSYKWDEVVWGARFATIIDRTAADGIVRVDVHRLSEIEPVAVP